MSLPDGKEKLDASEITFRKVNKHHAETYICTANNGFDREVIEKLHLDEEFSTEVEVLEYVKLMLPRKSKWNWFV